VAAEIIYYVLQYFDSFDPSPIPICVFRLTFSLNLGQFHNKMAVIQSILPALVYIISYLLVTVKYLRFKRKQNSSNNLIVKDNNNYRLLDVSNENISGHQKTSQGSDDHWTDFRSLLGIGHSRRGFVDYGSFSEPA